MRKASEYVQYAEECRAMAKAAEQREHHLMLDNRAQTLDVLAEIVKKLKKDNLPPD